MIHYVSGDILLSYQHRSGGAGKRDAGSKKDGLVIHYVSGDILLSYQHRSGGAGMRAPAAERTGS